LNYRLQISLGSRKSQKKAGDQKYWQVFILNILASTYLLDLKKLSLTSKFSYLLFFLPTLIRKQKLGLQIGERLLIAKLKLGLQIGEGLLLIAKLKLGLQIGEGLILIAKLKLGLQIGEGLLIANHLEQS
jgi:hypothetical protein